MLNFKTVHGSYIVAPTDASGATARHLLFMMYNNILVLVLNSSGQRSYSFSPTVSRAPLMGGTL